MQQTIYISQKPRRHGRTLKLEASQIIPLHTYLSSLPSSQEKLFDIVLHPIIFLILKYFKGLEPCVRNAGHLRQSRIMIWVSANKLREAQEKIGHKFATSTENYSDQNTTELVDEINRVHLFR